MVATLALTPSARRLTRFAVVGLPGFRLERCGWTSEDCVVLVAERHQALRLLTVSPVAKELGLYPGMTAAEARALVPDVHVEPLDTREEEADLQALVQALTSFSDRVQPLGPALIALDITHTSHLFGGEAQLLQAMRSTLQAYGHRLHLAVTDHPEAGAVLVRAQGEDCVVPPGSGAAALAPLSLTFLELSESLAGALHAIGLRTIGAFADLDPASVRGRYGPEGMRWHRIVRGEVAPGWLAAPVAAPAGRVVVVLDEPLVCVDALLRHVERGLEQLHAVLVERDQALAALDLRLALERGHELRISVHVGHPTRDPSTLQRLLKVRLERLTLQSPIVGVALDPREVVPGLGWQEDLLDRREANEPLPELLARLIDVLGSEAVCRPHLQETWRPEAAWSRACPLHPPQPSMTPPEDPVAPFEQTAWEAVHPRPTLLRTPPMPIRVLSTDGGVPRALGAGSRLQPVVRVEGPETLEGDWWDEQGGYARQYWTIQLACGENLWIFEERDQWFLHGSFD